MNEPNALEELVCRSGLIGLFAQSIKFQIANTVNIVPKMNRSDLMPGCPKPPEGLSISQSRRNDGISLAQWITAAEPHCTRKKFHHP